MAFLEFHASSCFCERENTGELKLEITEANAEEVLAGISLDDIIKHCGMGALLDSIGESNAAEHFGISENDWWSHAPPQG